MTTKKAIASEVLVRFSSDGGTQCPVCKKFVLDGDEKFNESAEHLFRHGLECLYVGPESHKTEKNQVWTDTVAIFGK